MLINWYETNLIEKWFILTITLLYGMILCLWTSYIFGYIGTWIILEGNKLSNMWSYEIIEGGKIYIYEIDDGNIYGNGYGYVYTGFENVEILLNEHAM